MTNYTWEQLSNFNNTPLFSGSDGTDLQLNFASIRKPYSSNYNRGKEEFFDGGTPLGKNNHLKSNLLRYLQWLYIFRTFRRGVLESYKSKEFSEYKKQNPWYVIVCEHDQMRSLVAEWNNDDVPPISVKDILDSKIDNYKNIENLVANRNIEEPTDIMVKFLREKNEFDKILDEWDQVNFKELEDQLTKLFIEHYQNVIEAGATCGGLYFEWFSTDNTCDVFGYPFAYTNPL